MNQRRAALLAALAAALPVLAGQVHGLFSLILAFAIGGVAALSLPSKQSDQKMLKKNTSARKSSSRSVKSDAVQFASTRPLCDQPCVEAWTSMVLSVQ